MSKTKQFRFLDWFAPVFTEDKTYWVISGGRASGKSTQAAAYFLMKLLSPEYFRGVVTRYTQKSISSSIYRDILDLVADWGVAPYLTIKGEEIRAVGSKNMITTHAMRLQEGTVTAKGKGLARVTHLLIDEATELPMEEEYIKLIDSFRQKGSDRKIFLLFNPTAKSHWIFKRFFLPDGQPNPKWTHNHGYLHTTYKDNSGNLDPKKIEEWEDLKVHDPDYYDHHIRGDWRDIGDGQVFKNWEFTFSPDPEAEIVYGLDWGFSSDPTALVKIHKRGKSLWIEELLYKTGLTNEDISANLERLGLPKNASIYADSAEPKSIETLRRMGWKNISPATKGPDSVRAGIDRLRSYNVFVHPGSENMIQEYYNYAYRTGTDKPIDDYNHLMDALRYGVMALHQEGSRYAVTGRRSGYSVFGGGD
jgi:phage terminase large subunit